MKSRILTVVIGVAAAAAVLWGISAVNAQPGRREGRVARRFEAPIFEAPIKALNLTAEQQEKLKALRLVNDKEMVRLRADQQIAQMELHEILDQDNPNPTEVKAKVDNLNKVRSTITAKMVDFRLGMNKILTPEQREKLRSFQGMGPMWRGRGGMGMGGHRGMGGGPGGGMGWGGPGGMGGPFCPGGPANPPEEPGKEEPGK